MLSNNNMVLTYKNMGIVMSMNMEGSFETTMQCVADERIVMFVETMGQGGLTCTTISFESKIVGVYDKEVDALPDLFCLVFPEVYGEAARASLIENGSSYVGFFSEQMDKEFREQAAQMDYDRFSEMDYIHANGMSYDPDYWNADNEIDNFPDNTGMTVMELYVMHMEDKACHYQNIDDGLFLTIKEQLLGMQEMAISGIRLYKAYTHACRMVGLEISSIRRYEHLLAVQHCSECLSQEEWAFLSENMGCSTSVNGGML